jgi:hypothetical protein
MEFNVFNRKIGVNRKVAQSISQRNANQTLRNFETYSAKLCGKNYQLKNIGIEA